MVPFSHVSTLDPSRNAWRSQKFKFDFPHSPPSLSFTPGLLLAQGVLAISVSERELSKRIHYKLVIEV